MHAGKKTSGVERNLGKDAMGKAQSAPRQKEEMELRKTEFRPFDFLDFEFVSDPRVSPDGSRVAFVRHEVDPEDGGYRSAIFIVEPTPGSEPRPFTAGTNSDSHPRWSPDGRWLAFQSSRSLFGEEAGSQIWVMPVGGGEAMPLTRVKGGISGFSWSPDGSMLAFGAGIDPDKGLESVGGSDGDADKQAKGKKGLTSHEEPGAKLSRLYEKYNDDVKHIKRIKYKADGKGFLDGKRPQVFVIDFDPQVLGRGVERLPDPRLVTPGEYDHTSPAWSPNGKWLAVSACRDENADLQRFSDIWVFPVPGPGDAGAEPVKVTKSDGPAFMPSWSPDGNTIAYLGHKRELIGGYNNQRLWLAKVGDAFTAATDAGVDADGFELVDLTNGTDISFGDASITDMRFSGPPMELTWAKDCRSVYHCTSERGTNQLVRVEVESGRCSLITTGDRVVFDAHIRPDLGRAAMAVAKPGSPSDIHMLDLAPPPDGAVAVPAGTYSHDVLEPGKQVFGEDVIVRTNEDLLSRKKVYTAQRFTTRSDDEGAPLVDCWVLLPEGAEKGGGKVPTVLEIHGGPMAMYTGAFFFEFQLLVAAGFGIVFTNPRGSSGYGQDFRGAIAPGWGDRDHADIMAGLEKALDLYPVLDKARLGVAGGSYGGYMTNWIIGHTHRFKAAITMRCVSNLYSFWGTSDIGYLWDELYNGHPWETPENYRQQSPITYMGDVKTPTLVIHSEEDHRCPVEQGEQVFATLKKQGVESEFVRYPGESHGLSRGGRPWHRIHRLERILGWFERYL